jgi:hypothetical protein
VESVSLVAFVKRNQIRRSVPSHRYDVALRITLNLDPDVAQNLKQKLEDENLSLNEAVNQALRAGLKLSEAQEMFSFKAEPHACGFRAGAVRKLDQ